MKSFPLIYPADRPRTRVREAARTTVSLADARDHLLKQLGMFNATHIVLSSNAKLRNDGLPYSKQPVVSDPGVAVYFRLRGSTMTYCVSCDLNDSIAGNIRAVGLSLAELRAIGGRLGIRLSIILDLFAVRGDEPEAEPAKQEQPKPPPRPKAPPPPAGSWKAVLQVGNIATWTQVRTNYLKLAKQYHPDKGGTAEQFQQLQDAYEEAKIMFKITSHDSER